MKKIILIFLFFANVALSGCIFENDSKKQTDYSKYDIRNIIPNYEQYAMDDANLTFIEKDAIHWLNLSFDDGNNLRNKVEEYENELISALEDISPQRLPLKIAVDKYDLDNDGIEEIIAFHNGDGGAKDAGVLMVYFQNYNKSEIVNSIRIVGVPDVDILNNQCLGLIKKDKGTLDFIILNKLYVWNGDYWD